MKIEIRNFFLLIFLVVIMPKVLFPQIHSFNIFNKYVTKSNDTSEAIYPKKSIPWSNSFYISCGYGLPQGLRVELGYNFGHIFSIAEMSGTFDKWSNGGLNFGLCGRLNIMNTPSTPYILVGRGTVMALFGEDETYTLALIGFRYRLKDWLLVLPEIGLVFTSKYESGWEIFSDSPKVKKNETLFAFNISFEVELRQIF